MTRGAFCAAHAKGFQTNCRLLGTGDLKNPIFALAVGGCCEARKSGANGAAMPTDEEPPREGGLLSCLGAHSPCYCCLHAIPADGGT